MLCRIEACLSGRKNILRWGRLGSGNPGHRGRPLPVVRPHYRFSCAIGGAAFRLQSRDGEGRGGGLLAAAAGNDQSVSGEGPSLATSETYVTSYSSSFFATDGHGGVRRRRLFFPFWCRKTQLSSRRQHIRYLLLSLPSVRITIVLSYVEHMFDHYNLFGFQ